MAISTLHQVTRVVANNVFFHLLLPFKVIWQEFKVTEYMSTLNTSTLSGGFVFLVEMVRKPTAWLS